MINILVVRDREDNICSFKVEGHSGFDVAGQDIVCSAVAAIVQTAVIGLTDVVGIEPQYHQESGLAHLKIPSGLTDDKIKEAGILLETMLLGLKSIELGYGEYISIRERKVE
mgnify:FL=1